MIIANANIFVGLKILPPKFVPAKKLPRSKTVLIQVILVN